jgi:peptide/nickel transport system substrate-binding protein
MRLKRPLRLAFALSFAALAAAASAASAAEGRMTWGVHVSLTPAFFDPADATGTALPLMVYYAVHDVLVRPLPGTRMGAALAQSWSQGADGLTYEFVLHKGARFQSGDPVTAEDVKFSFERYRGASAGLLKAKVAAVEIVDPLRVRFRLKQPWPDFLTFYGTPATGAAWIVPRSSRKCSRSSTSVSCLGPCSSTPTLSRSGRASPSTASTPCRTIRIRRPTRT